MSRSKARDLRTLSAVELNHKKESLEKDLHDLRQKKITGQLDKPHSFKHIRRQLAQIHTILNEESFSSVQKAEAEKPQAKNRKNK